MKKKVVFMFAIFLMSCAVLVFIHYSNDHKECETKIETYYGSSGEKVIKEKHICNEKYNL